MQCFTRVCAGRAPGATSESYIPPKASHQTRSEDESLNVETRAMCQSNRARWIPERRELQATDNGPPECCPDRRRVARDHGRCTELQVVAPIGRPQSHKGGSLQYVRSAHGIHSSRCQLLIARRRALPRGQAGAAGHRRSRDAHRCCRRRAGLEGRGHHGQRFKAHRPDQGRGQARR